MNNRSGNALVIALVVVGLVLLLTAIGGAYFLFLRTPSPEELAPKTSMTSEASPASPTTTDLSEIETDVDALQVDDTSEDFAPEDTTGL